MAEVAYILRLKHKNAGFITDIEESLFYKLLKSTSAELEIDKPTYKQIIIYVDGMMPIDPSEWPQ